MAKKGEKLIMNKIFSLIVVLTIHYLTVFGQEVTTLKTDEVAKSSKSKEYECWQKIDLDELSFYAPRELKRIPARAYDSKVYRFESEKLNLTVMIEKSINHPIRASTDLSYSEKSLKVEGALYAWMWSIETGNNPRKYTSGVIFKLSEIKKHEIGISVFYQDIKDKETAEKIFTSVEFNPEKQSQKDVLDKAKQRKKN